MLVNDRLTGDYMRKFHVCYVSRKHNKAYVLSHQEIMDKYSGLIVHHEAIPEALSVALGNHGYLLRSKELKQIFEAQKAIHKMKN